jgi:hypothetical protein
MTNTDDLLREAMELLNEVRTGEDFEVLCHEHASKIEEYFESKKKLEKSTN